MRVPLRPLRISLMLPLRVHVPKEYIPWPPRQLFRDYLGAHGPFSRDHAASGVLGRALKRALELRKGFAKKVLFRELQTFKFRV